MPIAATAITVVTVLVGLIWISRHVIISRENRHSFILSGNYPGPPPETPMITVVVAAKDEADNIEACVRSMLAQDYPNFELIVCNDRSEDQTGAIVQQIVDEDNRLSLIDIEHLPDGWFGKTNAMQHGIAEARGEYFCMTDADCRQHSTRTLSVAMQYAKDNEIDLLSVLPTLEMKGFWENVIQPICSAIMMIWFRPDRVNNPKHSAAYANGAFMLIKQSAYQAIGTHDAVRQELNEDMRMAARIKAAGLRLRVVRSQGLYSVRMYTSLRQSIRGWSRIFFGTFGTLRRLLLSILLMLLVSMWPYIAAAVTGAMLACTGGGNGWTTAGAASAVLILLQMTAIWRYYRLIDGRPWLFWTYPIGCILGLTALFGSLAKLRPGAKVVWKSTPYAKTDPPPS